MALLLQVSLAAVFVLMAFAPSLSFPWNSFPLDKSGWNPVYEEMLLNSGETSGRPSRRKNTILGVPCELCGQVIFGTEALTHHYNYHFLQNELASFGRSDPCLGSSQPSTSRQRPSLWSNYFHGEASTSRESAAATQSSGQQNFLPEQWQQPHMTLNDYLTQPPHQNPSLRSYSGAAHPVQQNRPTIDMAHQLPLHPLLAQPPRTTFTNNRNVQQQNQLAAGQLGQRRENYQVRCNNSNARPADDRPAANQQPPQDVIDVNEEHDCSSDGSEVLDLTLSL